MKKQSSLRAYLFIAVLIISLYLLTNLFWSFIEPIVLALILVSVFYPLHSKIHTLVRYKSHISATITSLIIFLCVIVPMILLGLAVSQQAFALYDKMSQLYIYNDFSELITANQYWIEKIQNFASSYGFDLSTKRLASSYVDIVRGGIVAIYDHLGYIASNTITWIINFFVMIMLIFTFLFMGPTIKQYIADIWPLPKIETERIVERFKQISMAVFLGNGIVALIQGFCGGLGIYLFGAGPAVLLGAIMAFAAFLPVVGTSIIFIPITIYFIATKQIFLALGFLLYNIAYALIAEYLIKPKLISSKTTLNAMIVFFSVLAGITYYGIFGIFYGPLIVSIFMTLVEIYKENYKRTIFNNN